VSKKSKAKRENRQRRFTAEFKQQAVARMGQCESVTGLARELGVNWRLLYRWREEQRSESEDAVKSSADEKIHVLKAEVAQLQAALATKVLEVDFLKGALQKVEAGRRSNAADGAGAFTTKSGK
jgi:transposase-like protein